MLLISTTTCFCGEIRKISIYLCASIAMSLDKESLQINAKELLMSTHNIRFNGAIRKYLGPVVQSIVTLTSSLRVISLTVLADSISNILIFFAEKM